MGCVGFFIYCRISNDPTGKEAGVQRQERECRALAETNGWEVLDVLVDNDISAYAGKPRPGFEKLMSRLDTPGLEGVIVWHVDRLYRRLDELERIVRQVEKYEVTVQSVKSGELDLSTPHGRMIARITGTMATYEVEHAMERLRSSQADRARRGKYRGGRIPFGYVLGDEPGTLAVNEDEAKALRWAAGQILDGVSVRHVATLLNEQGYTTGTNKPWDGVSLRNTLKAATPAGLVSHKGKIIGKGQWDAIIDLDTHERLLALFRDPSRRTTNRGVERRWQGSGVYFCGKCGSRHIGVVKAPNNDQRKYTCRECHGVTRDLELVDEVVNSVIVGYLGKEENRLHLLTQGADRSDYKALLDEREVLLGRKNTLADMYADGTIDEIQVRVGTKKLQDKLAAVSRKIDAASQVSPALRFALSASDIAEAWGKMEPGARAAVIRDLVDVTIMPASRGRYFTPSDIRFKWRA